MRAGFLHRRSWEGWKKKKRRENESVCPRHQPVRPAGRLPIGRLGRSVNQKRDRGILWSFANGRVHLGIFRLVEAWHPRHSDDAPGPRAVLAIPSPGSPCVPAEQTRLTRKARFFGRKNFSSLGHQPEAGFFAASCLTVWSASAKGIDVRAEYAIPHMPCRTPRAFCLSSVAFSWRCKCARGREAKIWS